MTTPRTFYRIYGSLATVCLIPLTSAKQGVDGSFYCEDCGCETVYPSKHLAWEKVKADLRAEIAEREKMLEAVILAWSKDEPVAKAPL